MGRGWRCLTAAVVSAGVASSQKRTSVHLVVIESHTDCLFVHLNTGGLLFFLVHVISMISPCLDDLAVHPIACSRMSFSDYAHGGHSSDYRHYYY